MLEWGLSKKGTYSGGSYDSRKITFPKSFNGTPFWGMGIIISPETRHDWQTGTLYSGTAFSGATGTAISSSYMWMTAWNDCDYRWLAFGKTS